MSSGNVPFPGYLLVLVIFCSSSCAEFYANHSRGADFLRSEIQSLQRQSRFLTFETLDDDLKIALEFIVPFMSVPVKRTVNTATGYAKGLANINLAALVLTGITVIAGVSAASGFTHLARIVSGKKKTDRGIDILNDINSFPFGYRGTTGEKGEASISEILSNIEAIFREYDVDITSCVQKTICFMVQESTANVSRGKGSSTNKIIDGLTSTNWLLRFLTGTAIKDAIDAGRSRIECKFRYQSCKWSDNDIREFIDYM